MDHASDSTPFCRKYSQARRANSSASRLFKKIPAYPLAAAVAWLPQRKSPNKISPPRTAISPRPLGSPLSKFNPSTSPHAQPDRSRVQKFINFYNLVQHSFFARQPVQVQDMGNARGSRHG